MEYKKLKIIKKEYSNTIKDVYDITVSDEHHYILKNGVISHNSGSFYNSHIIIELSKAQLKEENNSKTGIIVTSKIAKSRLTRAGIDIKFYISFLNGMNPYVGLQDYVSWDICGIGPGKFDPTEGYEPETGANPKYYSIQHLNEHVKAKNLFAPEVFRKSILNKIEKHMKTIFEFPDPLQVQKEELEKYTNGILTDDEVTENDELLKS